jgi:hypothetical protein
MATDKTSILVVGALVGVALLISSSALVDLTGASIARTWFAGAVALGLLSGFTTGASHETGAGTELMKFLSGAIIAPLLGSVVSLTSSTSPAPTPTIHPMWAIGAFFMGFGSAAMLGIMIGISFREKSLEIKQWR